MIDNENNDSAAATFSHKIEVHEIYDSTPSYEPISPEDSKYTPEQTKNIQTMEFFQKQLPNTFFESSSNSHKKTLTSKEAVNGIPGEENDKYIVIMSEDGITVACGKGHDLKNPNINFIRALDADKIQDSYDCDKKRGGYHLNISSNAEITDISQLNFEDWDKEQMTHLVGELKSIEKRHEHDSDEPIRMTSNDIQDLFV